MKHEFSGLCDWCHKSADDLVEHNDIDEGADGRIYDVCRECRRQENERLKQELEEIGDDDQPYGFEPECYMDANGHCSAAGSEHCDWDCPERSC